MPPALAHAFAPSPYLMTTSALSSGFPGLQPGRAGWAKRLPAVPRGPSPRIGEENAHRTFHQPARQAGVAGANPESKISHQLGVSAGSQLQWKTLP